MHGTSYQLSAQYMVHQSSPKEEMHNLFTDMHAWLSGQDRSRSIVLWGSVVRVRCAPNARGQSPMSSTLDMIGYASTWQFLEASAAQTNSTFFSLGLVQPSSLNQNGRHDVSERKEGRPEEQEPTVRAPISTSTWRAILIMRFELKPI